jgi:hypothetical protein
MLKADVEIRTTPEGVHILVVVQANYVFGQGSTIDGEHATTNHNTFKYIQYDTQLQNFQETKQETISSHVMRT